MSPHPYNTSGPRVRSSHSRKYPPPRCSNHRSDSIEVVQFSGLLQWAACKPPSSGKKATVAFDPVLPRVPGLANGPLRSPCYHVSHQYGRRHFPTDQPVHFKLASKTPSRSGRIAHCSSFSGQPERERRRSRGSGPVSNCELSPRVALRKGASCTESPAVSALVRDQISAASNRGINEIGSFSRASGYRPARYRDKVFNHRLAHQIPRAFNARLTTLDVGRPNVVSSCHRRNAHKDSIDHLFRAASSFSVFFAALWSSPR